MSESFFSVKDALHLFCKNRGFDGDSSHAFFITVLGYHLPSPCLPGLLPLFCSFLYWSEFFITTRAVFFLQYCVVRYVCSVFSTVLHGTLRCESRFGDAKTFLDNVNRKRKK